MKKILNNYTQIMSKICFITAIYGNTFVDLSWDTPFNGGKNITNYVIQRSTNLINWNDTQISSKTTSFRATNLLNNH